MIRIALSVWFICAAASTVFGQEPVGAKEAIRLIREKSQQQATAPDDDQSTKLGEALIAYKQDLSDLSPDDAAARWLELYDLTQQAEPQHDQYNVSDDQSSWKRVLNVLPGPDAWPALATRIEARDVPEALPELLAPRALRLFGLRITGQFDKMKSELKAVEDAVSQTSADKKDATDNDNGVFDKILQRLSGNAARQNAGQYENVLTYVTYLRTSLGQDDPIAAFEQSLATVDSSWGGHVEVPDLVKLAGEERASELLLKAFKTEKIALSFNKKHDATIQLAGKVALANVESLASPPWGLCMSTDVGELFEALLNQFKDKQPSEQDSYGYLGNSSYSDAVSYYFLGLILRGENETATKLFTEQASGNTEGAVDLFSEWRNIRISNDDRDKVYQFLFNVAKEHPEFTVWDQLLTVATQLGRGRDVRELVDEITARPDLPDATRLLLRGIRADVLLAAGDIEEALEQLRRNVAAIPEAGDSESHNKVAEIGIKILNIGRVMKRPEWMDEGFTIVAPTFDGPVDKFPRGSVLMGHHQRGVGFSDLYIQELVRRGQIGKAESILINLIAAGRRQSTYYSYGGSSPEVQLAQLYLDSGRHADVVELLDEATWWSVDDLSGALSMEYSKSLAFIAAQAFLKTDQSDLARTLLERLVFANPGQDAVWSRLLEVSGNDFPEIAKRVFQRNQFEERPLIWLGQYQLDAGDIPAAEKTIRQAISIDPSDGEQGKGDRMRVYAVLADILAAKGDDQAEVFRGAVRAIRMAEDADDFLNLGMYSLAVELYNAALEQFADAYCIQSRLAIQLAEHGDLDGAARHYKRAFELMPDSFGRVESHCFGCEGAFNGELASTIADQVFNRLATERPHDAKVQYLLGYLRTSQGRADEALASFRSAVTLDPDYVNAWTKILELREETSVPAELVDDAALSIYRLAPLKNRYGIGMDIRDLKRLWQTVAEVEQRVPRVEPTPIYPLKGAAEARRAQQSGSPGGFSRSWMDDEKGNNPMSPNDAISSNSSIEYISQILQAAEQ